MSNQFVLWGGYGGHNLGDEAILWAMSRLLRKLKPDYRQSVLVRQEPTVLVASQYMKWGIEPVRLGTLRSLRLLRSGRLVIGGGQLLDDSGLAWPVGWTSLLLLANAFASQRALILCIGAEPIARRATRFLVKRFYSLAAAVTCRDEESVRVVTSLGIPSEKVISSRDVVFSLQTEVQSSQRATASGRPRIVMVVAHDPQRTPGKSSIFLKLAISLAGAGCEVFLVAHDLRVEYDYGMLQQLKRELEDTPHVSVARADRVEDVLQLYADSDAVISSRMHPLILSSLVRSLPIAIPGTRKVASLIKNLALPSLSLQASPGANAQTVLSCLAGKDIHLPEIAHRIAEFRSIVETTTAQALAR